MKDYYNTTKLSGKELETATGQAKAQDFKVLDFFKDNPGKLFTPDEVHYKVFSPRTPVTSVRRSITNLTKQDLLEKVSVKRMGKYGKATHTWKLKINDNQLRLI